jgi:hypothetical protein
MAPPVSVTILYNKANTFGLSEDAMVLERLLQWLSNKLNLTLMKPRIADIREPLVHSDIQIHLEIPVYGAIPWAHTNLFLVNPDHWSSAYYDYVPAFDGLLFRDPESTASFKEDFEQKGISAQHLYYLPWCSSLKSKDLIQENHPKDGFVFFIGASKHKYEYIKELLPNWQESDPGLTIYTVQQDMASELHKMAPANVFVICKDMDMPTRTKIMSQFRGHLVVSQAEGFGYTAAHAEMVGAFTIMNSLPVFRSMYSTEVAWLSNRMENKKAHPTKNIRSELDQAFALFRASDPKKVRAARQAEGLHRFTALCEASSPLFQNIYQLILSRRPSKGVFHCPPLLQVADCPPISVITPTYNRKKLIDIAFHNLLATDYPQEKIEWIVIEDNEKMPHMAGEKVMNFQLQAPKMKIKYMPIEGRMSIGQKRNLAIEQATNEIILFMDDDDHYPSTSFRRRVAWLTKGTMRGASQQAIAGCTTIALYDLNKGISAVNVPPLDIACSQRISEATLTFYKSVWEERKFPDISVSEGEGWLEGRIDRFIEIPPQQIIVAFSHGANQTSRRIPPTDQPPSCFWGFPKEYLIFIHGLVGVQLEEDKKSTKKH